MEATGDGALQDNGSLVAAEEPEAQLGSSEPLREAAAEAASSPPTADRLLKQVPGSAEPEAEALGALEGDQPGELELEWEAAAPEPEAAAPEPEAAAELEVAEPEPELEVAEPEPEPAGDLEGAPAEHYDQQQLELAEGPPGARPDDEQQQPLEPAQEDGGGGEHMEVDGEQQQAALGEVVEDVEDVDIEGPVGQAWTSEGAEQQQQQQQQPEQQPLGEEVEGQQQEEEPVLPEEEELPEAAEFGGSEERGGSGGYGSGSGSEGAARGGSQLGLGQEEEEQEHTEDVGEGGEADVEDVSYGNDEAEGPAAVLGAEDEAEGPAGAAAPAGLPAAETTADPAPETAAAAGEGLQGQDRQKEELQQGSAAAVVEDGRRARKGADRRSQSAGEDRSRAPDATAAGGSDGKEPAPRDKPAAAGRSRGSGSGGSTSKEHRGRAEERRIEQRSGGADAQHKEKGRGTDRGRSPAKAGDKKGREGGSEGGQRRREEQPAAAGAEDRGAAASDGSKRARGEGTAAAETEEERRRQRSGDDERRQGRDGEQHRKRERERERGREREGEGGRKEPRSGGESERDKSAGGRGERERRERERERGRDAGQEGVQSPRKTLPVHEDRGRQRHAPPAEDRPMRERERERERGGREEHASGKERERESERGRQSDRGGHSEERAREREAGRERERDGGGRSQERGGRDRDRSGAAVLRIQSGPGGSRQVTAVSEPDRQAGRSSRDYPEAARGSSARHDAVAGSGRQEYRREGSALPPSIGGSGGSREWDRKVTSRPSASDRYVPMPSSRAPYSADASPRDYPPSYQPRDRDGREGGRQQAQQAQQAGRYVPTPAGRGAGGYEARAYSPSPPVDRYGSGAQPPRGRLPAAAYPKRRELSHSPDLAPAPKRAAYGPPPTSQYRPEYAPPPLEDPRRGGYYDEREGGEGSYPSAARGSSYRQQEEAPSRRPAYAAQDDYPAAQRGRRYGSSQYEDGRGYDRSAPRGAPGTGQARGEDYRYDSREVGGRQREDRYAPAPEALRRGGDSSVYVGRGGGGTYDSRGGGGAYDSRGGSAPRSSRGGGGGPSYREPPADYERGRGGGRGGYAPSPQVGAGYGREGRGRVYDERGRDGGSYGEEEQYGRRVGGRYERYEGDRGPVPPRGPEPPRYVPQQQQGQQAAQQGMGAGPYGEPRGYADPRYGAGTGALADYPAQQAQQAQHMGPSPLVGMPLSPAAVPGMTHAPPPGALLAAQQSMPMAGQLPGQPQLLHTMQPVVGAAAYGHSAMVAAPAPAAQAAPTPGVRPMTGGRAAVDDEPIWFYTDPQGVQHGPHSISQFRRWLGGLADRPDLCAEYEAFKAITVFRRDKPAGVPLMMLLK